MILIRQIVRYQNERPRALSLGGLPGWCNPRPPTAWPFPMAATGFGPRARPLPLARLERPQPDERDVAGRHGVHPAFSVACAPLRLRQDPSFWVPIEAQPPGAGSTLPRVLPPWTPPANSFEPYEAICPVCKIGHLRVNSHVATIATRRAARTGRGVDGHFMMSVVVQPTPRKKSGLAALRDVRLPIHFGLPHRERVC